MSTEIDLDALEAAAKAATPGPRRWEVNRKYKTVMLAGGKPTFDLSVLTFERWGMHGATVCFLRNPAYGMNNLITTAQDMATPIAGREHHADWCASIDNPDASYIAAMDPSTALTLIAMARRAKVLEDDKALLQRRLAKEVGQTNFVTNELVTANTQIRQLEEALRGMVDASFEPKPQLPSITPWQSTPYRCACRPSYLSVRSQFEHALGCPVPAAERALAEDVRETGTDAPE